MLQFKDYNGMHAMSLNYIPLLKMTPVCRWIMLKFFVICQLIKTFLHVC